MFLWRYLNILREDFTVTVIFDIKNATLRFIFYRQRYQKDSKTYWNVMFIALNVARYLLAISLFLFLFLCGRLRPWAAGSILLLWRCFRPMSVLRLDLDEAQLILFLGVITSLCYMCICAYKCVNSYFYVRVSWVRKYWTCYLTNYLCECYFRWVCLVWEHIEVSE